MIAGGRAGQDTRALGVVVELEVEEAERSTTVLVASHIRGWERFDTVLVGTFP